MSAWVAAHFDDNGTRVLTTSVLGRAAVPGGLEINLGYENDAITGASVDAITTASRKTWHEMRHGATAAIAWSPTPGWSAGAAYLPSVEPDYLTHAWSAHVRGSFFDDRLGVRLVGGFSRELQMYLSPLRQVWGRLELGAVLDRRTTVTLSWESGTSSGYLSSPYLWVVIDRVGAPGDPIAHVPDAVPNDRPRHAVAGGVRRAFSPTWFGSAGYRYYSDGWGIRSHAGELELQHEVAGGRVILAATARLYGQTGARFWRARYVTDYPEIPRLRTTDKMLGPLWTGLGGLRCDVRFAVGALHADLVVTTKLEIYVQRFLDYEPLSWRRASIGSLGLALEW